MEFFYRVLDERLQDGFIIVNRYTGTSDYFHLVKVLKAQKEKAKKHKGTGDNGASDDVYASGNEPSQTVKNKVEIVVQYIIEHYTEKVKIPDANNGAAGGQSANQMLGSKQRP